MQSHTVLGNSSSSLFTTVGTTSLNTFDQVLSKEDFFRSVLYYALLYSISGIGNILSILVSLKILSNRLKIADLLLCYLGFTDLFCLLSTHPLSVASTFSGRWLGMEVTCAIQYYFAWSCLKMSFFILILMTFDRYLALVKPIYFRTRWNSRRATFYSVYCFLFSFGSTLLTPILQWDTISPLEGWFVCLNSWSSGDPYDAAILIFYGLSFVIGLIVFNICNIRIALELFKLRTRRRKFSPSVKLSSTRTRMASSPNLRDFRQQSVTSESTESRTIKESRTAVIVLVISIVFVVSWSPYLASIILNLSGLYYSQRTETIAIRIVFANTALNPLLYGLLNRTYRRGYCYFLRIIIYYCLCGCIPKPKDDNIFYKRRSWLQNRQRELYSKSQRSETNGTSLTVTPHFRLNPYNLREGGQLRISSILNPLDELEDESEVGEINGAVVDQDGMQYENESNDCEETTGTHHSDQNNMV
ncbi:Trace amine-associated receptor 7d [Holothuria leucospilota]|uniref:Trace amine-associated receptor 7d n=1 Tax=Holothuria leucospilota TaxID=206669 RepID=A0A9Q1HJQ6_HOLLE|nr:Trace amine-associated receptor 7d [Holothuria leucospilota]